MGLRWLRQGEQSRQVKCPCINGRIGGRRDGHDGLPFELIQRQRLGDRGREEREFVLLTRLIECEVGSYQLRKRDSFPQIIQQEAGFGFLNKPRQVPRFVTLEHGKELGFADRRFEIELLEDGSIFLPKVLARNEINQQSVLVEAGIRSEERRVGKECRSRWS